MKQCPDCRRVYADDSLNYCLDDGSTLVYGPRSDEPPTAILQTGESPDLPTKQYSDKSLPIDELTSQPARPTLSVAGTRRWPVFAAIALAVLLIGFLGYRSLLSGGDGSIRSIAVLPFANDGGKQDLDYISDGLPETLIYRLSQIPQLKVSPRSSVFRYKGKSIEAATAGSELGADAVLSGNVTQLGDNLVINVELIDVRTNKLIWGDHFDRQASDLLAMQREIAGKITENLRLKMTGAEKQIAGKQYTTSPEAYQLYLKGRNNFAKRADANLRAAMDQFRQAASLDPNFALAYTGLADCYSLLPIYDLSGTVKAKDTMPLAKEAVLKAISIDDSLAEAHASLGLIYDIFDWNTTAAEKEYRRAIELNPNYAQGHQWYAEMLCNLGRFDEGLAENRRALEAEPFALPANFAYGLDLYKARRYDEAIKQFNVLFDLAPDYTDAHAFLFQTYIAKGDYPNAVSNFIRQQSLSGQSTQQLERWQNAFNKGGWRAFVAEQIRYIESNSGARRDPNEIGFMYALAGNKDKAIEWLNRAVEERGEGMTWLLVAPRYDSLRDDPRFQDIVKRVGFSD